MFHYFITLLIQQNKILIYMKQNILNNFIKSITSILVVSVLGLFTLNIHASDIDLQNIEKALEAEWKNSHIQLMLMLYT